MLPGNTGSLLGRALVSLAWRYALPAFVATCLLAAFGIALAG